jgi:hypothetical protein
LSAKATNQRRQRVQKAGNNVDIPSFRYDGILKDHGGLEYGAAEVGKDYIPDSDKWKRDKMKLIILMNDLLGNLQRYAAHRRLGVDGISVVGVLNTGKPPLYIHWISSNSYRIYGPNTKIDVNRRISLDAYMQPTF